MGRGFKGELRMGKRLKEKIKRLKGKGLKVKGLKG